MSRGSRAHEGAGKVLRGVGATALGASVVLLAWSVGLALWAWRFAPPSPAIGAWDEFAQHRHDTSGLNAHTPKTIAIALCCIAGILLVLVALAWLTRRAAVTGGVYVPFTAIVSVVILFVLGRNLERFVTWMQFYPRTPQLPATYASWRLGMLGVVLVTIGGFAVALLAKRVWRGFALGGAVIAVVLSLVGTLLVFHAGDDSRFVNATVAAAVTDDAPVPATLGDMRFTVPLSKWTGDQRVRPGELDVQPVTGGFVTFGDGRIAEYDHRGKERWHYGRTGPDDAQVTSLHVFDDGRTVLAGVGDYSSVLIAFDAGSGERLWWSSDRRMVDAYRAVIESRDISQQSYLVALITTANAAEGWTRYDTRTGKVLWYNDVPSPDCRSDYYPQYLRATIRCMHDGVFDVEVVAIDPETGETEWRTTLAEHMPDGDDLPRPWMSYSRADNAFVEVQRGNDRENEQFFLVDFNTRRVHRLTSALFAPITVDESDEFLGHGEDHYALWASDGRERCQFDERPAEAVNRFFSDGMAVVLADEVVFAATENRGGDYVDVLRVYDRADCAPLKTILTPENTIGIAAAPGVTLVTRTGDDGTWVDGYA